MDFSGCLVMDGPGGGTVTGTLYFGIRGTAEVMAGWGGGHGGVGSCGMTGGRGGAGDGGGRRQEVTWLWRDGCGRQWWWGVWGAIARTDAARVVGTWLHLGRPFLQTWALMLQPES